ncbi:MAG: type II toxin-antitoxin system HicA family toxin [Epsilonproteobacteria bacterium]|nr:type II toxin-antitoxin system HicA family toxin [Campylobacterota bacterium]
MSRYDKLIDKLKNNPKDVSFQILKKILEENGYIGVNTGGSHWVFRKDGKESITIPYKRPIKIIYVKKVIALIGV